MIFSMKEVRVAAAVIEKDGKILIAERAYGKQAGLWEFPGGKLEEGESAEKAIVREIFEEFDVKIRVKRFLCRVEHHYEVFDLNMDCFICEIIEGDLVLHDHSAYAFIDPHEEKISWVPADLKVIAAYRSVLE